MKLSLIRSLTLALALSAGLAHAQVTDTDASTTSDGTLAGTPITNTASGSYLDPSTGTTGTLDSNTVITTVLPKPGFDILYVNGNNDGLGNTTNVGNSYNTAPSTATATIAAGGTFNTPYVVVNNGNTVQTITLTSTSAGANAPTVNYYLDSDKDGVLSAAEQAAGAITTIKLPYDDPTTTADEGLAYFIQVITLPTSAVPGSVYTASPVGTGKGFDTTTSQPVDMTESTTTLGLQYATVTVTNNPPVPADVTNAALLNTAGPTTISGLVATDDGSVASYTIQTLPATTSGKLYYADGTTPVKVGDVLTPAQAASLKFAPAAGFTGNATFDYTATDNLGLPSSTNKNADGTTTAGAATFTIPVQAPPSADLSISKTINGTSVKQITKASGSTVYFYIRVTNNGPASVTNPVVKDVQPSGMVFNSITCTGTTDNTCSSTVPAPTIAQLQTGYTIPTTLASGAFYEFYISAVITASNVIGSNAADNTAIVTAPTNITDSNSSNDTSTARIVVDAPPVPVDENNALLLAGSPATTLSLPLTATDSDGTVVSYAITQLPATTSGVLYLSDGTTPVTTGMVLTPAQAASLKFAPAAGFIGTAQFQYTATDNDGLTSTNAQATDGTLPSRAAYYTIPVSSTNTALQCTSTVYGVFGSAPLNNLTINSIDSSGNVGATIATLPYTSIAALAVSPDGKTLYVAGQDNKLRSYNVTTGIWTTIGTLPSAPSARPVRMATDKNGIVYISALNFLWTYDGTTLSAAKTLNFTDTTGLSPAPVSLTDGNTSGDFIVDSAGNLYLITNNPGIPANAGLVDVFRIQNISSSTPTITFVERLTDSGAKSVYAGFAALPGATYAITDGGRFTTFDLGALTVTPIKDPVGSGNTTSATDLTSCYYPTLQPSINSTKSVTDVNTSSTTIASPGDTLEYSITIHNAGNIAADGVTFQDLIPTGTTYVAGTTTTNGNATADVSGAMPYTTTKAVQTLNAATGTNLVGTTRDVVIKFRVKVNAGVTTVSNTGTLGYNDNSTGALVPTTKPTNTVTIGSGAPQLQVTKKVDTAFLKVTPDSATDTTLTYSPTQMTYTVTVKNIGTLDATNVKVSDTLPGTVKYVSGATQDGTDAQKVTWPAIATLAIGASQDLTVVVKPNITANINQGQISNTASALADNVTSVPSNAALTDIIYPKLSKTVQNISQGTAVSPTGADGLPGQTLEYCLAYNNYSTVALPNYTITDFVPGNTTAKLDGYGAGLGIKLTRNPSTAATTNLTSDGSDTDGGSLTTSGGTYSAGTLTVKLGSVAAGESGKACFQVTIK